MTKQGHRPHVFRDFNFGLPNVMFCKGGCNIDSFLFLVILSVCFINTSCYDISSMISNSPSYNPVDNDDPSVCSSKDIRNSVSMFEQLQGCKVVEGFIQIVLIDKADSSDYSNISFPELREITGYLLLYRVHGLTTLGKLFPNLTVIRGNTLFLNYALVVYEMLQLQDIGLNSLTNIIRGAVYFAKNPMLCFVTTVDWDIIAPYGKGEHHIMGNKKTNECPLCSPSCPKSITSGQNICWNLDACQKICPNCNNGTCYHDGECCHPSCLGGCSDKTSNSCFVCRNFLYNHDCLDSCPPGTYKYLNRRCVSESECYNLPKPREINDNKVKQKPWKPFKETCLLECPSGYVEKDEIINGRIRTTCEKCKGICKKECPGANVDSIATIQKLKGCTSIKGALEIQVRGGNIVKELEENLKTIEEIDEYLKIVRSYPLISLNFLSHLNKIHGYKLENNKYALVVLDNANLVDLWDWSHRQTGLQIENGRLFFHFNPKLCYEKIDTLRNKTNLSIHSDLEIARNSNGDQTSCNVEELQVSVYKKTSMAVLIKWRQFENHDRRTLLGYVVYSVEAPYKNVSMYDRRDACGDDMWQVDDVSIKDDLDASEEKEVNHIIAQLKPYTQYAYYVKTYTIATETRGAQSPIQYFRTDPDTPLEPQSITIFPNSSSQLLIHWKPPLKPNGNVTHYVIKAMLVPDDEKFLEERNHCLEPLVFPDMKSLSVKESNDLVENIYEEKVISTDTDSCSCNRKLIDNRLREKEIHFEDHLQNSIYIKRVNSRSTREKRALSKMSAFPFESEEDKFESEEELYKTNGVYLKFRQVVYSKTSFVIRDLKHFSHYKISIQACREWEEDEDKTKRTNCSKEGVIAGRTLPLENSDDIDSNEIIWEVSNTTHGIVRIKWQEPANPNSIILTYQIQYWKTDLENYKPSEECITRKQFKLRGNWYTLKNLSPGNYSFRIRATSLYQPGNFTKISYFFIEEAYVSPVMLTTIVIIVTTLLFLFFVSVPIIVFCLKRYYQMFDYNTRLFASVNPEYVPSEKVYTADSWEVPRENVKLLHELGHGTFGMVYEGKLMTSGSPQGIPCAVKTVNSNSKTRNEFLNEASIMKAFNTQHVIKLLGVVSHGQPTLVIMELMEKGDLKAYLRSCRKDSGVSPQPVLTVKSLLRMSVEVADGMAYLAAKKFVHRDLAARNCMVSGDLTVKVGDFGMTRDIYETEYYRKGTKGLLPVRWMAPESLRDGVFSSLSDVWSYGVLLYEMTTLASQPYQGLANEQVLKYVVEGGIMERPTNCDESLYTLMVMCWQQSPKDRPSFLNIVSMLKDHSGPDFPSVSFYDSEEGQEIRVLEANEETPLILQFSFKSESEVLSCFNQEHNNRQKVDNGGAESYGDINLRYASEKWIREIDDTLLKDFDTDCEDSTVSPCLRMKSPDMLPNKTDEASSSSDRFKK